MPFSNPPTCLAITIAEYLNESIIGINVFRFQHTHTRKKMVPNHFHSGYYELWSPVDFLNVSYHLNRLSIKVAHYKISQQVAKNCVQAKPLKFRAIVRMYFSNRLHLANQTVVLPSFTILCPILLSFFPPYRKGLAAIKCTFATDYGNFAFPLDAVSLHFFGLSSSFSPFLCISLTAHIFTSCVCVCLKAILLIF